MNVTIPRDLEALVEKQLASGAFTSVEDVLRRALENLDAEEPWTEDDRKALDAKIDRSLQNAQAGKTYGPDEARKILAALREAHLADHAKQGR